MRRAILIYNPKSGRQAGQRLVPGVLERLGRGFDIEPRPTAAAGDATRLARQAVDEGVEVVFALGGDGTLRETAKGLLGSPVALGPLPAGTTNVVTLALGLPRKALAAAEVLAQGEVSELDVGRVAGEPFLMQASAGLDSAVMARQSGEAKRRFGKAAIGWVALREWRRYGYPTMTLDVEGRRVETQFFAVCNLPYYGGSFRLAPAADPRDGHLDLVLFHGQGPMATAALGRDLLLGRHHRRPDVELLPITRVDLLAPPNVLLQLDGDVLRVEPPVTFDLAPHRLKVLGPAGCGSSRR